MFCSLIFSGQKRYLSTRLVIPKEGLYYYLIGSCKLDTTNVALSGYSVTMNPYGHLPATLYAVPSFHSLRRLACAALFPPLSLLLQLPLAHNQSARHGQLRRFFPIHSLDESLARSRSHSPPLHRLRVENTRLFITSIEADRCITRSVSRPLRPCSSFCFTLYSKPL